MAVGVPLMIILLSVGMLTQGDVTDTQEPSILVVALQSISPIYYANKAICLQEYQGMLFEDPLTISLFGFIINRIRGKEMKMKEIISVAPTGDDIVEELTPIVRKIAVNNAIVVMVCNFGQSQLLLNFACSARAVEN